MGTRMNRLQSVKYFVESVDKIFSSFSLHILCAVLSTNGIANSLSGLFVIISVQCAVDLSGVQ